MIDDLEQGFYKSGPLKGRFLTCPSTFLNDDRINNLIAWDHDIQEQRAGRYSVFINNTRAQIKRITELKGYYSLRTTSTGKTMMAKSLANRSNQHYANFAEMIYAKNQVKRAFEVARKLSPTLMIIEDIDTAGTVSRRFTDHPIPRIPTSNGRHGTK